MIQTALLGLVVGVPLGFALQRGGFCMNTAFRSMVFEKDRSVLRAYVLVLLINLVSVSLLDGFGIIFPTVAPFYWPALLVGGFIFGVGMVLAGGCTSGTWYRAGKGMLGSVMALMGFALGAAAMEMGVLQPLQQALRGPVWDVYGQAPTLANVLPDGAQWVRWLVLAALVCVGAVWLLRSPQQRFVIGWTWRKTGLVVGVLAVLAWVASGLTFRDYGLSFTQPTVSIVSWLMVGDVGGINWGTFLVLGVPVGAFLAAKLHGEFALKVPAPGRMVQQLGGGVVMGLGASLAGGCNIGHGITGISALSISSIVATAATILGVWLATWLVYSAAARQQASAAGAESMASVGGPPGGTGGRSA